MIKKPSRILSLKASNIFKLHTTQVIILSFLVTIIAGTILLSLPISSNKGHLNFIDAFFTATSAVCVTGLIVVDTATQFTRFGQTVILILIQLGGLGIMTFGVVFSILIGGRVNVKDRMVVQSTLFHSPREDVHGLIKSVFLATFTIEFIGFCILFFRWLKYFPVSEALFNALFHSVSAFCNAGFSTFSNSLEAFKGDTFITVTIMWLIIMGGIGFLVHAEIRNFVSKKTPRRQISLHAKMAVLFSVIMIIAGALFIFFMESGNTLAGAPMKEKLLGAFFQSVTTRTAGFNTLRIGALTNSVLFIMIIFMFIGASSGSTGGGIKVSTFAVLFALFKSRLTGKNEVSMFNRTIPHETISKCLTIVVASTFVIAFFVIALSISEAHNVNTFVTRGSFF